MGWDVATRILYSKYDLYVSDSLDCAPKDVYDYTVVLTFDVCSCIRRIDGSTDCHPTECTVLNRTSFVDRGSFVGFGSG